MRKARFVVLAGFVLGVLTLMLNFATPQTVWVQAALENSQAGSFHSGIGIVSGWKCTGGQIAVSFEGDNFL